MPPIVTENRAPPRLPKVKAREMVARDQSRSSPMGRTKTPITGPYMGAWAKATSNEVATMAQP